MSEHSSRTGTLLSCLRLPASLFGRLRLLRRPDESIRALAALGDDELCSLSESGLRLRREARRCADAGRWARRSQGT